MKTFIPADQETRILIETNLDETLAVSAGAGTGKTTLLTKRYISLLQQKKISPTEIVAITFTKKAASELRERIYDEMIEHNMKEALLQIELAPIGTIHSFCSTVLKRFAIESGLDPHFKQIEDIERYEFLRESFRSWMSKNVLSSNTYPELKSSGLSFSNIQYVAFQLYQYRDLIHTIHIEHSPVTQKRIADFVERTKSIVRLGQDFCTDMTDEGYMAILALHRITDGLQTLHPDIAANILLREEGISKKGKQTSWKTKDHCKQFKTQVDDLRTELENIQKDFSGQLLQKLVTWLEGFLQFVELEKKRQSVLDFDDLLLLTRDLIRNNIEVRRTLQSQFKYFLIDEFQDTDPIQTEIFWMLSKKSGNGGHSFDDDLIPGKIFTVGDVSQSIYRFRNASVETYRRCVSSIERQGKLLLIYQNFRSNPYLLSSLNPFFTGLLQTDFHELSSLPDEIGSKPAIHVLKRNTDGALKHEVRGHEAYSIASHIRHLVDSGTQIVDQKQKCKRKLTYADIAILFPVSTSMEIYELAFKAANIPFNLYRSSSFFQTIEIRSVLHILHAVTKPFDQLEVTSALSSFLLGFSFDDLIQVKKTFGSMDFRAMDPSKLSTSLSNQIKVLQNLHINVPLMVPSQLVSEILRQTRADQLSELRNNHEQIRQNLQKFVWLAQHFEKEHGSNVFEFVDWIHRTADHSDEITEARLPTEPNAIQLMTIHQAKGLEFSVVFVANLASKMDSNVTWIANRFEQSLEFRVGDRYSHMKTKNFDPSMESEKKLLLDEKKRLMYVALTRAKNMLVLPEPAEDDQKNFMELVAPLFDHGKDFEMFNYSEKRDCHRKSDAPLGAEEAGTVTLNTEYLKKIPKGYPRSTATEEKEQAIVQTEKKYPFITRPKLGIAFHAYVERHNIQDNKLNTTLLNQIVIEHGIQDQKMELEKLVTTFLTSDIFKRIQNAKQVLKEVPFSYFDNGILYEGYVDLIFSEDGKTYTIVDLKTDQITETQLEERSKLYEPQLNIYAKALGPNVKERILYFVRLDESSKLFF